HPSSRARSDWPRAHPHQRLLLPGRAQVSHPAVRIHHDRGTDRVRAAQARADQDDPQGDFSITVERLAAPSRSLPGAGPTGGSQRVSRAEAVLWRMRTIFDRVLPVANRVPIGERTVCVGSDRLFVDSIDRALAAVAWKLGLLEGPERRLIARVVQPGMIAVDVGANIGLHTLALARRVGDAGVVIAVEPDPSNFRLLTRAVTSAGLSQVRMIQAAAEDRGGEGILHVSPANRVEHRLHVREVTSSRRVVREVAGELHMM